jgi:hypothetical protein
MGENAHIIGLVHKFVRFFNASTNLFFIQIIKQSINYVFSSITHDCLPKFGQVFDPTLGEISRFGVKNSSSQFWSSASLLKETLRRWLERERKRW